MITVVSVRINRRRFVRAVTRTVLRDLGYTPRNPAPLFVAVRARREAEQAARRIEAEGLNDAGQAGRAPHRRG